MNQVSSNIPATQTDDVPNFGSGRYSNLMVTLHKQVIKLFDVSTEVAEKFARQAATDYGAAMKDAKVEAKFGKATGKDMQVTLSEAAKVKNVTSTPALNLAHAIQWIGEAGKHGVSYGHTSWMLDDTLRAYLTELE